MVAARERQPHTTVNIVPKRKLCHPPRKVFQNSSLRRPKHVWIVKCRNCRRPMDGRSLYDSDRRFPQTSEALCVLQRLSAARRGPNRSFPLLPELSYSLHQRLVNSAARCATSSL